ncbi:hypothetical protein A1D29_10330 [Pasteurellaceae bacterium Orientalotternb1]|nr:hypothetical protein A1D29_10330 [Pasteurellaceae bacterium Orientalotternb1]
MKHILIDFENIQPTSEDLKPYPEDSHIWLFLGKNQKTLSIEFCEALCRFGKNVHFRQMSKIGKNALDFYLSFYIGYITGVDDDPQIDIFSHDGGYDLLLQHLSENKYNVQVTRKTLKNITDSSLELLEDKKDTNIEQVEKHKDPNFLLSCQRKIGAYFMENQPISFFKETFLTETGISLLRNDLSNIAPDMQKQIIIQTIENLKKKGLIKEKSQNQEIIYRSANKEEIIEDTILYFEKSNSKPSTPEKMRNVIISRLRSYCISENNVAKEYFSTIYNRMKSKKIIREVNNKIEFAPFSTKEINPIKEDSLEKIIKIMKKWRNKPSNTLKLNNALKSHLKIKNEDSQEIIQQLNQQKIICIDSKNKIQYLI